jgi:hypothetical protein
MSEKLNWKIVPGSEHRALNDTYSAIPTAVLEAEDVVYYRLKTYHSDGTTTIHGMTDAKLDIFRSMYAPEDQSCIPYLVAALMAVEWIVEVEFQYCEGCQNRKDAGHAEGCVVKEALEKAGAL